MLQDETQTTTTGPWWVAVLNKWGVSTAIAAFLIYWLTSVVSARLDTIQERLNEHVTATNMYLYAVCKHTARTPQEQGDCLPPR